MVIWSYKQHCAVCHRSRGSTSPDTPKSVIRMYSGRPLLVYACILCNQLFGRDGYVLLLLDARLTVKSSACCFKWQVSVGKNKYWSLASFFQQLQRKSWHLMILMSWYLLTQGTRHNFSSVNIEKKPNFSICSYQYWCGAERSGLSNNGSPSPGF